MLFIQLYLPGPGKGKGSNQESAGKFIYNWLKPWASSID